MKKQNNQLPQTFSLAVVAAIFLFSASASTFAQGVGARYGARDPRTCADKTQPKSGAPSPAQAVKYVICSAETVNVYLYLVEDVEAQISKGRPYNIREDINVPNIDVEVPVYPIRGSYKSYQCDQIRADRSNFNRNCTIYTAPNATGLCYKDTFGDWHCSMTDARTGDFTDRDVPPPGAGAATSPDEKTTADKIQQNNGNSKTNAEKDENGLPKPDFSALDNWYDIVRYEYDSTGRYLYLYVKPKADEARETEFFMEFTDKDGIVYDRTWTQFLHMPGRYDAQAGETVKAQISLPPPSFMKDVLSAKAVIRPHY